METVAKWYDVCLVDAHKSVSTMYLRQGRGKYYGGLKIKDGESYEEVGKAIKDGIDQGVIKVEPRRPAKNMKTVGILIYSV